MPTVRRYGVRAVLAVVITGLVLVGVPEWAQARGRAPLVTAEVLVTEATAGLPGTYTISVAGAAVASVDVTLDGVPQAAPTRSAEDPTAWIGSVTWTSADRQTLTAVVTTRKGRTTRVDCVVTVARPDLPHFQLVYLYPADGAPVDGRVQAIPHVAAQVDAWYAQQMGGPSPRFATDTHGVPSVLVLQSPSSAAEIAAGSDLQDAMDAWRATGTLPLSAAPVIFLEGTLGSPNACGWSRRGDVPSITMPMANCRIYPSAADTFPYGGSYLLAHEMAHALGGVSPLAPHHVPGGHVSDSKADVIYHGVGPRDWTNLTLDPGHDDYYLTGRSDLPGIESSPFLER
jgi:hypothetical protein